MMSAGYLDIQIDQGSTFALNFRLKDTDRNPVSLTGAVISGKIRLAPESADPIVAFTGTVISEANGEGQISLTAVQTAAIAVDASGAGKRKLKKYLYDVEVDFLDGTKQRVLEGLCLVSPEVTR